MNGVWQDIRYGARMLWKHRLTSLICAAALALGIGANTAMFSVAEAFLLHPVPFEHANRIVALSDSRPQQGIDRNHIAPLTYLEWQSQAKSFDQLGAYQYDEVNLTGDREPQKIEAVHVLTNFFGMLGVPLKMGRGFLPEEETPGRDQEIVLGHGLWEQRYGSDPSIVGKTIKVDGKSFTVVGVARAGMDFPMPCDAWIPLALDAKERSDRATRSLWVLGRLKPGVSVSEAAAEMQAIEQRQAAAYPDSYKGWQLRVMPIAEFASGDLTRQYTFLLLGAVGFVLLIACADVANVQFARVTGRQKELAVRAAMGASRGRIAAQLLTESILLALGGAAMGLLLAMWEIQLIVTNMPADVAKFIAGWKTISLDSGAFIFTLLIAVVSGIVSGIAPSLLPPRASLNEMLKEGGRGTSAGRTRHRLRGALVVAEIALALILLVGAGLMTKGFQSLLTVNQSLRPESLLTMNFSLPELQYAQLPARTSFREQALERLAAIPGVKSAAIATAVPYANGGGLGEDTISIEGAAPAARGELRDALFETVSPNYFRTLNIPLRDGRELLETDTSESLPVAVISESLAGRYLPGGNPLGKKIKIGADDAPGKWMTVVGVVDDVRYTWINKSVVPTLYMPYRQRPRLYSAILVRTERDPAGLVSAVRAQIAAVDPDLPLFNIKPLSVVIRESITGIAYVAAMMAVLGIIALVLASVGVYGVMSYSVSERTHEIGIRVALGASERGILRLVVGNGMLLTVLGIAVGLPLALGLAFALSDLLFGVKASDPVSFIGLPLLLAAIAALASYLPARKALRVDPLVALRHE
jgi:putative ABC transport system permease protein